MPYYLQRAALGRFKKIELDRAEYEEALHAWQCVLETLAIQETWEVLLQNYVELELEILTEAMHSMVFTLPSSNKFHETRLNFSRKLANLLSSCRSYLDHTPQHLHKMKSSIDFKSLTNSAYDGNSSYRFMEGLRNYAQHKGLPLHGVSYASALVGDWNAEDSGSGLRRHTVAAYLSISKLQEELKDNPKFKKFVSILNDPAIEIESLDLTQLTREYIEAMGGIQDALQKQLKDPLDNSKKIVRNLITRYAAENNGDVLGLSLAAFSDAGLQEKQTYIFDNLILRLEGMVTNSRSLANLKKRYVTNEIIPPRQQRKKNTPRN